MRVIGGTVPEPGNLIWVLVYLPRDDLAPAEFFVLTSSDLHTLLKPVQDAWLKKCQEQHGGPMPGVCMGCAVAKSLLCLRHRLRSRRRMDGTGRYVHSRPGVHHPRHRRLPGPRL